MSTGTATGTGISGDSGTDGDGGTNDGASSGSDGGNDSDSGTSATDSDGGCSGLPLCDDFESDTAGQAPNPALWTIVGSAGCSGQGNPGAPVLYPIAVDTSRHHSGTRSLKVVGGDSCGPLAVDTSAFSALTAGEVYARFYVSLDPTQVFAHAVLGANGIQPVVDGGLGFSPQNQSTFLQLSAQTNGGSATDVFYWSVNDSDTMPPQSSMYLSATTYPSGMGFSCFEFHFSKTGKSLETWVDGTAVTGLTSTSSFNSAWVAPSALTSFGLGLLVLSGNGGTTPSVWFDDVALSTSRIGCN